MLNPITPWTQTFALPKSDDALVRLIRVAPVPQPGLQELSPYRAAERLDESLKTLCHPSKQDLRVLRELTDIAWSHAAGAYASLDDFVHGAQGRYVAKVDPRITMLTGPAGVGKSCIADAMRRLFASERSVKPSPKLPEFPIRPVAVFRIGKNSTSAERLNSVAESIGLEPSATRGGKADLKHLILRLYQRGTSMLIPDELQFLSMTETSAQVSSILLGLGLLGLPVTYIANYDLGHKLKARSPQDTARLLPRPIIMLPDPYDDPAFLGLLGDIATVIGVVEIDFDEHAREIHALTFGLRRCVRRLFVAAYLIMREERRPPGKTMKLTMEHLRAAYTSKDYGESRIAVECSRADLLDIGKPNPKYTCPFELPPLQEIAQRREADRVRQAALDRERGKDARTGEERRREQQAARVTEKAQRTVRTKTSSGAKRPQTADEWLRQLDQGNDRLA